MTTSPGDEDSARILLLTGKGGVGKTTTAAATAAVCAARGARTLVLSTDPAHSLADAFDLPLADQPAPLHGSLWGQQLDAQARMEESWGEIADYLAEVFRWAGLDDVAAEELAVLPGLDEVFALSDIRTHARSGEWDVVVVDCAPTAETIRLLSLPEILAWYMERVFPVSRRVNRLVSPVLGRVTSLPVAGDEVFGAGRRFYERLEGVKELLGDAERASVRLVVNPERMVIAEARRTHTYLSLFGYHVDAVVANRLLPAEIDDPWFDRWKELQALHMSSIEEGFAPVPVLRATLADTEIIGLEALEAFGSALYGEADPTSVLHRGTPLRVRRVGDDHILEMDLPFAERDVLELARHADELLVKVGPYRRAVVLPDTLRRRDVAGASLRDGVLRITFDDRHEGDVSQHEGATSDGR
ncbi:MAG: ArsA family ATPase [Acidimicrobiia bacterium]|nr:ArsA family ATPase [Acidimicrobiia bacterium]